MNTGQKHLKLRVLVAVEEFKSRLGTLGLNESEIQQALEAAILRTEANPLDMIKALSDVYDEISIRRGRKWHYEANDASS